MLTAFWGIVRGGKIEVLDPAPMPEGSRVLITVLDDATQDAEFWQRSSHESLRAVWDNPEDDVYAELLPK